MTYIYILFDDCPDEHGEKAVLGLFLSKKNAQKKLKAIKERDEYTYQYTVINRCRISDWPK